MLWSTLVTGAGMDGQTMQIYSYSGAAALTAFIWNESVESSH